MRTAIVWRCRATDHTDEGFLGTLDRLFAAARAQPALRRCRLVLASPDDLGDPRVRGVEVVDARAWLETWDIQHRCAEGVAAR